jgi:hypothetical protein
MSPSSHDLQVRQERRRRKKKTNVEQSQDLLAECFKVVFLLGLLFDNEGGRDIPLRNVS